MKLIPGNGENGFVVNLQDESPEDACANTLTQYGMSYPDGSVRWNGDPGINEGFAAIANQQYPGTAWLQLLKRRAEAAHVDEAGYVAGHKMLTRRITVVIGEIEEA